MSVEIQELACREGYIGQLTLNSPARLNALSEQMIADLQNTLDRWAEDSRICLIILQGAGDRAFCAGGDIKGFYGAARNYEGAEPPTHFFSREYRLDYTIHRYPKPILGIAHGIIMGGGLGLLSACRYRLVTPDMTMAMPEISIGLFPDVGASWFLNRLPGRIGLFIGLTGARLNISDAIRIGLADMALLPENRSELLAQLQDQRWTGAPPADDNRLFRLLTQMRTPDYRAFQLSNLEQHEQTIARLCAGGDLAVIVDRLLAAEITSDWWEACTSNLRNGCPVSAWLVWTQLKKAQQMSLKDVFRMELAMAQECMRRPDLPEGIRALAIDKDYKPRWSFSTLRDVPEEVINAHFQPVWDDESDPMQLD
ncbi:MAG TPA: enoyl-CoA hydratase/isomerase family protein [Marinobacter sp.]|nr:enoyl-CoA hydratase/isomerase family protein [Marinobacter sp.]